MRRIIIGLTLILAMLAGANAEPRLAGVGVVLLHGKRVAPPDNLTPVRSALEAAGARVVVPEMSWSRARAYDGTFEQAMEDIDRHVGALRGAGATRIVVAGHGMGANAALGYAARRRDLFAVAVLGPGHTPERGQLRRIAADDIERARRMIRAGAGDAVASFEDIYQGQVSRVRAPAKVYFSWFDPNGVAVMPRNARAMRGTPFLYAIGNRDPLASLGPSHTFDIGADDERSRYLVVQADRRGTPEAAAREFIAWLASL